MENYGVRHTIDLASENEWSFIPIGGTMGSAPYRIKVPYGGWYNQGFDCDSGIYERWISIPDTGYPLVTRLEFEAINFYSEIYLGEDCKNLKLIQTTSSSWMPVIADITEYVQPGKDYFLRIYVKGREACTVVDGNSKEYCVPEGANWTLTMDSGILRGAYLRLYPAIHVEDVFIKPSVSKDLLEADIWIKNHSSNSVEIEIRNSLSGNLSTSFSYPDIKPCKCLITSGELSKVHIGAVKWGLGENSYWWPNVPYKPGYKAVLYDFGTEIWLGNQKIDNRSDRFGFREFTYKGKYYYLNGTKCNLRGHNQTQADFNRGVNHSNDAYGTWPGFLPSSNGNAGWPGAVDNYLRLNSNVIRIHQIPCTRYMLDVCDEMGLMVIAESSIRGDDIEWAYQYEDLELSHKNGCKQVKDMIKRDRNHPGIIMWSLANEPWVGKKYSKGLIYNLNRIAIQEDDTRVRVVDGAVHPYDGDIVAIKHYWPAETVFEWEDKPNGMGEYGSMVTERGILEVVRQTIYLRLKKNIADLRPWHITHAWSAHIPGVRREDIYNEHNSVVYKRKDDNGMNKVIEDKEGGYSLADNAADCKSIGRTVEVSVYLDEKEPWEHYIIKLLQNMFNPIAAFDKDYWVENIKTDMTGKFTEPEVFPGQNVCRTVTVFNDMLTSQDIDFKWEARLDSPEGKLISRGENILNIQAGDSLNCLCSFGIPCDLRGEKIYILLSTFVEGKKVFEDSSLYLTIKTRQH